MAFGFGIPRSDLFCGDIKPQIFIQERPAKVDVIEQHQRLIPITLVFKGVCQSDDFFTVDRVDAAAQHHVLTEQGSFPHLRMSSQVIVIPIPIRIGT